MSVASFFGNIKRWFETTEAEVLDVIIKIEHGIEYEIHELENGLKWLEGHAGDIATAVETVAAAAATLSGAGVVIPPEVVSAVKYANAAVAGLNAMVSSQEKGTPQALVDGYVASKNALTAANKAAVAVATTKAQ